MGHVLAACENENLSSIYNEIRFIKIIKRWIFHEKQRIKEDETKRENELKMMDFCIPSHVGLEPILLNSAQNEKKKMEIQ